MINSFTGKSGQAENPGPLVEIPQIGLGIIDRHFKRLFKKSQQGVCHVASVFWLTYRTGYISGACGSKRQDTRVYAVVFAGK